MVGDILLRFGIIHGVTLTRILLKMIFSYDASIQYEYKPAKMSPINTQQMVKTARATHVLMKSILIIFISNVWFPEAGDSQVNKAPGNC